MAPDLERKSSQESSSSEKGDIITPWDVSAEAPTGVDYDKLIGMLIGVSFIYHFTKRFIYHFS